MPMKFGLLLPHFGEYADRDRLLDGARLAEAFGFDSVWVRDHLIFEPHGEMEKPNRDFYDALITLTAIGAVTEKIELGTGSLIPFRHPLEVAAHASATITQLVGPRLILRLRRRHVRPRVRRRRHRHRDQALGPRREQRARSSSKVWTENAVDYKDDFYAFDDVTIEPKPVGGPVAVLVLRQHARVGAPRRRVLRRLDARADLARHVPRARRQDARALRRGRPRDPDAPR